MQESEAPASIRGVIGDADANRRQILFEVTRAFAEDASDYERVLDTVARKVSEFIGDVCMVRLLSEDGESLGIAAMHSPDEEALGGLRPMMAGTVLRVSDDPTVQKVLQSGQAFLAARYDSTAAQPLVSPLVHRVTTQLRIHSRLIVPLRIRGRSIGVLSLGRFRASSAPFDEVDLTLAQFLADHAALAIGNARAQAATRAANAALESAMQRYRALLENANDLIAVTSLDGIVLEVNRAWERAMGISREQALGRRVTDFVPEGAEAARTAEFKAHIEAGGGVIAALAVRRPDGTVFEVEGSRTVIEVGGERRILSIARDVTERHRMEEELHQARVDAVAKRLSDRLASAVESIEDAFVLFDDDDRAIVCNTGYRRLLDESPPATVMGRTFEDLLERWSRTLAFPAEVDRARFLEERLRQRHAEQPTMFEVVTQDGRSLRVVSRRTTEGGIVETISDVTGDKRQAHELREARAKAEAANEAKSEFLASMSHELRTPLNAILGFGQLLRRDRKEPLSARHNERLDRIIDAGEQLIRLVDDILDLSRIEAGGVSISIEALTLAEVLAQLKRTLEPMAALRNIRLDVDDADPRLPLVAADRGRLAQILMNFGSNAVKYNRPGGKVTVTASSPGPGRVRIAFQDTGVGIAVEKQEKLFQPFQRVGQESGPIEGTGIGLVITKRLAGLMGGDVGFRSVVGEGSEFWVDMPVSSLPTRAAEPAAARRPSKHPPLASDTRPLVVYVEDNAASVAFMEDLLGTLGNIDLVTAPTAELGIEVARERRPDAIIMDINLPGMSGLEALGVLRAAPETRSIPVIGLTANAFERDKSRGLAAGFHRYLTKPLDVDALVATLEELFPPASNTAGTTDVTRTRPPP